MIGEIAADLALEGGTDHDIDMFRIDRFGHPGEVAGPAPRTKGGHERMTRTIVCFGDSNTHGAQPDPAVRARFPRDVRWPGVMRAALGEGYEVIEEALGGRCTVFDTPISPGTERPALPGAMPRSPTSRWTSSSSCSARTTRSGPTASRRPRSRAAPAVLVDIARGSLCGPGGSPPRVLLVAPVPLGDVTVHSELWGFGASRDESRRLAALYRLVAEDRGVGFLDAGSVAEVSPLDGVHLDATAHAALGVAMADAVRTELARPARGDA